MSSTGAAGSEFFRTFTQPDKELYPYLQWTFFSSTPGHSDVSSHLTKSKWGFNSSQKFLKTDALKSIGTAFASPHHAGCLEHCFDSDDYWTCVIYHNACSAYHTTSSCKMANDSTGVVDSQLRVKGIDDLRVVDASVLSHVTSCNIMGPIVMIAEKAADMIKQAANK